MIDVHIRNLRRKIETQPSRPYYILAVPGIGGGSEPATITDANFAPARLLTLRTRNSAAYKGLYALAMSHEHLPVNLGNPTESTLLELAQTVVRVSSSKSDIVFEALPVDDPQVRQPDITRARQVLGWEPKTPLEEGLRRLLPSEEREAESVHV